MKEKIQLLSRGVFEYENPEIEVSEKEIALEVEAGQPLFGYDSIEQPQSYWKYAP